MRVLAASSLVLSILMASLLSVGVEAAVGPKPAEGVMPSNPTDSMDNKALEKKIINELALASGHMMGRKVKARESLATAERDITTLKERGGDAAFIRDQEETIADIKSIVN